MPNAESSEIKVHASAWSDHVDHVRTVTWIAAPEAGRLSSQVLLPTFRVPTEIHYRNDQDFAGSDLIEKAIRKAGCPATTSSGR